MLLIKSITIYLYLVVLAFGVAGNLVAFVVFSRKRFCRTLFSIYFRLLLIVDMLTLSNILFSFLLYNYRFNIKSVNYASCVIGNYVWYAVPSISGWLLVAVSFDRMLTIVKPRRFLVKNKQWFQILICAVIICFNLIYYLPIIYFTEYYEKTKLCTWNHLYDSVNDWMDLILSTIFPFTFMIVLSLITISFIFFMRLRLNGNESTPVRASTITSPSIRIDSIKPKDIKFAVTSIALNICFLLLNIPFRLVNLLTPQMSIDHTTHDLGHMTAYLIYYVNYGNVFYINILANSFFRHELIALVYKRILTKKFLTESKRRKYFRASTL